MTDKMCSGDRDHLRRHAAPLLRFIVTFTIRGSCEETAAVDGVECSGHLIPLHGVCLCVVGSEPSAAAVSRRSDRANWCVEPALASII